MTVKELDDQGEFESRRVWREVADGIRKGDFNSASEAKIKIEVSLSFLSVSLALVPGLLNHKFVLQSCNRSPRDKRGRMSWRLERLLFADCLRL